MPVATSASIETGEYIRGMRFRLRGRGSLAAFSVAGAAAFSTSVALALASPSALAGVANAGIAGAPGGDPLAGLPWGNYTGPLDEVFPAYGAAGDRERRLLGLIALRPRMRWFGAWYSDDQAQSIASEYIQNVTGGQDDVLSQMAVFRLDPWEEQACRQLPGPAAQASYKRWIDGFAAGIGSARVALVLQPDLGFVFCVPHQSQLPLRLVAYAAQKFSSLPHTTVYLDAGAADWETIGQDVYMLRQAGAGYVRGFALNDTHYDSTEHEIAFGAKLVRALAARGIPGQHFVINTAENGRPFTWKQYPGPNRANPTVCRSRRSHRCVTLGIPPTADVASSRWGLSPRARTLAARLVDAYMWVGRPWLDNGSDPFDLQRALALARTTPF
jgi:endoglucanase